MAKTFTCFFKILYIQREGKALIYVTSDDTILPKMLTHTLLQMATCEADIAGITSRTVNFVNNSAAEHLGNNGLQRGQEGLNLFSFHNYPTGCINSFE